MAEAWRIAAPRGVPEPYEVLRIERLTATIVELWLAPLGDALQYLPGEYVLLEDRDGNVPPRSYSLANAPRPDGLISLLVTRVPDGATSTWVHARLRVGDQVSVSGPYGTFVDDPAATAPALFLAAGSGLAPIRALLEATLAAGTPAAEPDLLRPHRGRRDRPRAVQRLGGAAPRVSLPAHPDPRAGPAPHGRIPVLLSDLYRDLPGHDVFIAGAPGFVRDCAIAADALGAFRASVHTEVFFADPQPWTANPAEARNRR